MKICKYKIISSILFIFTLFISHVVFSENSNEVKHNPNRDDCDFLALNSDHVAFTGTAHINEVSIKSNILPEPLTFSKSSIAYIHFQQLPYQPVDLVQLISGGSIEGEIVKFDELEFTIEENAQKINIPRDKLLALMFRCSIDASVSEFNLN